MREQRWESPPLQGFGEILAISRKLATQGLPAADPQRDGICYIEELEITHLEDIKRLDPWHTEDFTVVHILNGWKDDFYLLTGRHYSHFQQFASVNTYCSISHPWHLPGHLVTLDPEARLWLGFRYAHSFIRVRLQTTQVVTPGEIWADHQRAMWLEERQQAFSYAIEILDLPIHVQRDRDIIILHATHEQDPFFCSWPDAFGPCQFEFNSSDHYEFLVPASRLVQTYQGEGAHVRIYLTGFSPAALDSFHDTMPPCRRVCRCSLHCAMQELPELLPLLGHTGRLYMTLCEFQTQTLLPHCPDASAVLGIIGTNNRFALEFRSNLLPLPQQDMESWLAQLLDCPMTYAPLPAFP